MNFMSEEERNHQSHSLVFEVLGLTLTQQSTNFLMCLATARTNPTHSVFRFSGLCINIHINIKIQLVLRRKAW